MTARFFAATATASAAALIAATGASAQDWRSTYSLYGAPGLIEMPTAGAMPDAQLSATLAYFGAQTRANFSYQIAPRVTGTIRYAWLDDLVSPSETKNDRSVDLHFHLLDETRLRPALAVGLRDIIGDGLYSSEYIVASKSFGPRFRATAGVGWGQMGTRDGGDNPFSDLLGDDRDAPRAGVSGDDPFRHDQFFKGDAAFFGGFEYTINSSWRVLAEYSSDAYRYANGTYIETDSPYNFGINYSPNDKVQIGGYYMYGNEVGISATFALDTASRYARRGRDPAPVPISVSPAAVASWQVGPAYDAAIRTPLAQALTQEGIRLIGVQTLGQEMRVRYENTRYRSEAQAAGRVARILTQLAPPAVRQFRLEPTQDALAKSAIVIARSDLVALENELGAADALRERVSIEESGSRAGLALADDPRPRFRWGISPTADFSSSEADDGFTYTLFLKAEAGYRIAPGLHFDGSVVQRIATNREDPVITNPAPNMTSVPVVRRDRGDYLLAEGPQVEALTLTHLSNPAPGVYVRATGGYLERMYGGVSAEVLWKPADSRLGLGAELTYAAKRSPEGMGFEDYDTVTGFVSAYYEFDGDFVGRLDLGRYLAGDWGGTVTLERELPNGWRIGAYATMTDVSYDDFGSGSFEKGLLVTVPFDWVMGSPSQRTQSATLLSPSGDGGQRVDLGDGLYSMVRDAHVDDLDESWGRVWQ